MSEIDLSHWVGRSQEREDWITPTRLAAWQATFDLEADVPREGDAVPPSFHWTLFPTLARDSALGADGHALRGGFLPPVKLPRRMWAGSRLAFHQPLRVGERVAQRSVVAAVVEKHGRRGPMVLVTVRHLVSGPNGLALEEEQDLAYLAPPPRDERQPNQQIELAPPGTWHRSITPTASLLFRYSALTFNGHRIHYDRTYAERVEGYGGLVVHGPLIGTLLLNLIAAQSPASVVERFSFKAIRPTLDVSPFAVCGEIDESGQRAHLWSTDTWGQIAIDANAFIR